jgi:small-conductance mechanosensitive channel
VLLDYTLIQINTKLHITVLNLLLWVAFFIVARILKVLAKKYIKRNVQKQKITVVGRDITLITLSRQLINIIFLVLAVESLSLNNVSGGLTEMLNYKLVNTEHVKISMYNIILVVALVFVARLLNTLAGLFIQRAVSDKKWLDKGKEYTFVVIAKYLIYTIFIVISLKSFGIDLTLLVASSAALLVGLGLGIQKIFGDIISGFIILFEGTVKVGDIVELENITARVIQINIRTSKVRTRDGNVIIIPNSRLTTENVNNWSFGQKTTRHSVSVHVSYEVDVEQVKQILYDCALNHKYVDKKKQIFVFLEAFGDSALEFDLYFWTEKAWEIPIIKSELRYAIEAAFRQSGVRIPYPQRELRITSEKKAGNGVEH